MEFVLIGIGAFILGFGAYMLRVIHKEQKEYEETKKLFEHRTESSS